MPDLREWFDDMDRAVILLTVLLVMACVMAGAALASLVWWLVIR